MNGFLKDRDIAFTDVVEDNTLIRIRRERNSETYLLSIDATIRLLPSKKVIGDGTMRVNSDSSSVLSTDLTLS